MENIVRLTRDQITQLMHDMAVADNLGKSVRICTGEDSNGKWVKWDSGSGWTPPLYGLDY